MEVKSCPICGNKKLDRHYEPFSYQYNKGLPKFYTNKDWIWYDCESCFKKKGFFAFVRVGKNTFTWDSESNRWKIFLLNPSRRDRFL